MAIDLFSQQVFFMNDDLAPELKVALKQHYYNGSICLVHCPPHKVNDK